MIKGWDVAVASMYKGEVAQLECRPDYAYGENGSPPKIPPNATLCFEVELLRWEGEDIRYVMCIVLLYCVVLCGVLQPEQLEFSPDRDGSITKSIIVEGMDKYTYPVEDAPVTGDQTNDRVL